jgi:hypothetical protein
LVKKEKHQGSSSIISFKFDIQKKKQLTNSRVRIYHPFYSNDDIYRVDMEKS